MSSANDRQMRLHPMRLLLFFDVYAAPEGDETSDIPSRRLWIGVIPGRVGVVLPVNQQAQISCLALPGTGRCRTTWTEIFPFQTRVREIGIPFNYLGRFAFSNDSAVPDCSRHSRIHSCISCDPRATKIPTDTTLPENARRGESLAGTFLVELT